MNKERFVTYLDEEAASFVRRILEEECRVSESDAINYIIVKVAKNAKRKEK